MSKETDIGKDPKGKCPRDHPTLKPIVNKPHSFKLGFQIAFSNSTKHLTNASSSKDKIQKKKKT